MVIRITVSLDSGNISLDNTWLLGNSQNNGNEIVEVKPIINGIEKNSKISDSTFNIIFENNKVFLAGSDFVEEITSSKPMNVILKNLHVTAEFVQETNNCLKQYTSINDYFSMDYKLHQSNVGHFNENNLFDDLNRT